MSKLQIIVIAFSGLLFVGLYFGGDTKPETQEAVEKTRTLTATSTSIESLLSAAKSNLPVDTSAMISGIEKEYRAGSSDSSKVESLKKLASMWYQTGRADISGFYAEEVAKVLNDELSWSIAGTTYMLGARKAVEDKIRDFCFTNAEKAFQSAISINPSNYAHKVNLALCYTRKPSSGKSYEREF